MQVADDIRWLFDFSDSVLINKCTVSQKTIWVGDNLSAGKTLASKRNSSANFAAEVIFNEIKKYVIL